MKRKDFIRIINEEIGEFDFLNNDGYVEERRKIELLQNPQFQKQFIIDSITKMRDKIKFDQFSAHFYNDIDLDDQYRDNVNLEVNTEILYKYDPQEEPIRFSLVFTGSNIEYEPDTSSNEMVNWDDIDVNLYTTDGDQIDFSILEKAPLNTKILFIKAYVEDVIKNKSDDNKL